MPGDLVSISVVIATWNRAVALRHMLKSLAAQSCQPAQIMIVDASEDTDTRDLCAHQGDLGLRGDITWQAARTRGAASQRNQGVESCRYTIVGFFDDDILFEPECVARLWHALQSDPGLGGVNAMITNQRYHAPGRASRLMFRLLSGRAAPSYAGHVLGPAVNLLPEDCGNLPEVVPVEWLNTTCTLYRREALPQPAFSNNFTGYSL
jgi:glycosyltransferase involved in cell wall biosynthesis